MRAVSSLPPRAHLETRGREPSAPWSAPQRSPRLSAAAVAPPPLMAELPRPRAAGRSTPPRPARPGRLPATPPATRLT
eukprot:scaffold7746_cov59-Phaeocystis_antarctica.AAC.7